MRRCRGRTGRFPRSLPTAVEGRGAVRRTRRKGPHPRGASGPRSPSGSPWGMRLCAAGRIPAGGAWRGCGRRRPPRAFPRRCPPAVFPRPGNPGTPYNAPCATVRPSAPPPGTPGRCEGARSRGSLADVPPGGRSLLAADRYGETLAPLGAASRKNLPAAGGRHPLAEAVGSFPPQVVRLVCALHGNIAPYVDTTRSIDGKHIIYFLPDALCHGFSRPPRGGGGGPFFFFSAKNPGGPPRHDPAVRTSQAVPFP